MKYNISFSGGMFIQNNIDQEKWEILQKLYENNYLNNQELDEIKIPKIIHQIWLGGPFPEKYARLRDTWKKFHPDWEYHLWTDENIKDLNLINGEIFENTKNLGAKSDILRCEILYRFGGLYVDTDFECLKPFDDIHFRCDFYAGLFSSHEPCILNALIGSAPSNMIIKEMIERISSTSKKNTPQEVFNATGPLFLTRCFFDVISKVNNKCIIFPSTFFYPSPNTNSGVEDDIQKKCAKNETYAIHYWHISWTKKKKTIFKILKNVIKMILPYGIVKKINK